MRSRLTVLACALLLVLFSAAAVGTAQAEAIGFLSAVDYPLGPCAYCVAVTDLNGDGINDLVTASYNYNAPGTVSVLLGDGVGSLGAATTFNTGMGPHSIAVADLNDDGIKDIVTATSGGTGTVSVLLGNGSGGFGAKTDFAVGPFPTSVAIGDLNRDGVKDLVTANRDAGTISILLGNGTGGFGAKSDVAVGGSPYSVTIADFNGDAKQDLAVAGTDASAVIVMLGDGGGGFGAKTDFTVGPYPESVAAADLNGDGHQDLVTTSGMVGVGAISVILGNGNGGFGAKTDFGIGSYSQSVVVADFNGDGKKDLVAANSGAGTVSVLLGDGTGGFGTKTDFAVGQWVVSVAAGDLDGDGRPDLVSANWSENVGVRLQTTDSFMITVTPGTHGTIAPSTGPVGYGAIPSYTVSPDAGYHISSLTVDGAPKTVQNTWTFSSVTAEHSIAATFAADAGAITMTPSVLGGHGTISPSTLQAVNWGSAPKYTFTPDAGYHVSLVKVDGTEVSMTGPNEYAFSPVTADHAITVEFAIDMFTITPSVVGGHGSISPAATQTVAYGARPLFTLAPDVGYWVSALRIDGALVAMTGFNEYTFPSVAANHVVSVEFAMDFAPPTTIDDAGYAWQGRNVVVHFTATDAVSGVAQTRYRLDAGAWTVGSEVVIAAPADHSGDGAHIINYASTDKAGNVETTQTCQVRIDTSPPVTISDTGGIWHSGDVTVSLDPLDVASGVASSQYQVNGGVWTSGRQFSIQAAADHSADGTYTVRYRSTDAAGNAEVAKTCQFKIDTVGPSVVLPSRITASRGKRGAIRYRVREKLSPKAQVTLRISTPKGRVVKKLNLGLQATNRLRTAGFRCTLARGTYRVSAYASDLAGNKQIRVGVNKLVVK